MNKWYFSGKIVLHISCQTKSTADDYQIDWSNILASHVYLLNAIYRPIIFPEHKTERGWYLIGSNGKFP